MTDKNLVQVIIRRLRELEKATDVQVVDGYLQVTHPEVKFITELCGVIMRNEDGTNHWPHIRELRKNGFRTTPHIEGEDNRVWTAGQIETKVGLLVYGKEQ